jgi:O-methyltransferase
LTTAGFYAEVADRIPAGALPFMNYGYASPDEDYSWLQPGDEPYRYNLDLVRLVLKGVTLQEATVLECGSGRGGNCLYLDRYTDAGAIYGMDICEPHVRLCTTGNKRPVRSGSASSRARFLCGDAGKMPFASDSVDVLLNVESSHCYPDFESFLTEVRRVLKPGGLFACADLWGLSIFDYDWTKRQLALDRCGLLMLREEDVSEGVFRALQREDGLSSTVRGLANSANASLVDAILRANEAMRLTLASRQCCYKVMLMRRLLNA